jgi:hypothetical protein
MPDTPDHDRLVALEQDVKNLSTWRDTLTAHLDAKFDRIDDKIATLSHSMESKVDDLRSHMDEKIDDLRDNVQGTLHQVRLALPYWAQLAIATLIGLLGLAVGVLSRKL